MKILILPGDTYQPVTQEKPEAGKYYSLVLYDPQTEQQQKTREALIRAYWDSGQHPKYGGDPYTTFRDSLKRDLGAGFESYVYADIIDGHPKFFNVKTYDEIPERIRGGKWKKDMIRGKLKSCSRYTKREDSEFIDNLINDMYAAGVNTRKFQEIMKGIEERAREREMEKLKGENRTSKS